jgi:hypothetical protein
MTEISTQTNTNSLCKQPSSLLKNHCKKYYDIWNTHERTSEEQPAHKSTQNSHSHSKLKMNSPMEEENCPESKPDPHSLLNAHALPNAYATTFRKT